MPPPESARTSTRRVQMPGELRDREPGRLDMVGGGVRADIACPQDDGQRFPVPVGVMVGEGGHRVEPKVFFQVGAACSNPRSRQWSPGRP